MTDKNIVIEDLGNPVLTEMQRGAIAATPEVELTVDAVISAAKASTGLDDYGPSEFIARLEIWLQSIKEDKGLNALGRASLFGDCVRQVSTRLRFENAIKQKPEIDHIEIEQPIIIAGLPRSGTTHLVNILAADNRLRSMPLWESMEPISEGTPPQDRMNDPRRLRCKENWGLFETMLPLMPLMHEMNPDEVHEDVELLGPDFSGYVLEWVSRPYAWREHYLNTDQTPHYQYAKRILKYMTWAQGPNRWVLKSPPHMENLEALKATYPDATVVITHRDPLAVLQSAITMIAYADRIRRKVDLAELATYWTDRIEGLLKRCVAQRDALPNAIDVRFHEYMADQMGTVKRVYAAANLDFTPKARENVQAFLDANPRGKKGSVQYDLTGDFGVDIDKLRDRFSFYYERFGVQIEVT